MIQSIKQAFQMKEVRNKILYMVFIFIILRAMAHVPIPGLNRTIIQAWANSSTNDAFNFFNILSGGSLSSASILAVSITPYITASIIMELMTVVFKSLKELKDDGATGREKFHKITRYIGLAVALLQSVGTVIMYRRQGLVTETAWLNMTAAVLTMAAGSAFTFWIADRVTEKGYGNGSSFVLMVNIIANIPNIIVSLYSQFIQNKSIPIGVLAGIIILAVVILAIAAAVILEGATREIPITNSRKMTGSAVDNKLPLKVNMAGVIPIIFAQTIMSVPSMIQLMTGSDNTVLNYITNLLSTDSWFKASNPVYTLGFLIQLALVFFFAYYYTDISFSPMETAKRLQKHGNTIPGIRPGTPTAEYLSKVVKRLILIGAIGLVIVVSIPMLAISLSNAGVSFGGTSLIIVSGAILEIVRSIEAELRSHNRPGFFKGGM